MSLEQDKARDELARLDPPRPSGVDAAAILRVFRVPPESAGMRCDVFIQSQLRNTSRTRARAIVLASAYSLEGKRLRPSDRMRGEDRVCLWRPPFEEQEAPRDLSLLYEDAHLLVVDKPPLMTVHPTARHHKHTVIKRLEAQRPHEFLSLVHRLDRETSGALLVARSPLADREFKRLLENRSIEVARGKGTREPAGGMRKTYLAITWGEPPNGMIDAPLEPDEDNPLRVKMRVAARGTGLVARTEVTVLERRPGYALIACELHTGRQHQIRVHLASIGCPVVGDKLYGPDERLLARAADLELTDADKALLELPRHALHAHRYRLNHALTGEVLDLVSPLPRDLSEFWHALPAPGALEADLRVPVDGASGGR
ncbi:MAG TPA: RluA family pseudouridine synthase [Polyangiaceae bacterium]